jgi:hypothetical protein
MAVKLAFKKKETEISPAAGYSGQGHHDTNKGSQIVSCLMRSAEMALETLTCSPLSYLTLLIAREHFIPK